MERKALSMKILQATNKKRKEIIEKQQHSIAYTIQNLIFIFKYIFKYLLFVTSRI